MKKTSPPADPDAYVKALSGWRRETVEALRAAALSSKKLEEGIKWGHLVYTSNGPVLLIRAEPARVLFGFWRGQRLQELEPRLKGSGKYEMATIELTKGTSVLPAVARRLVKQAVALNEKLGDPTKAAKSGKTKK